LTNPSAGIGLLVSGQVCEFQGSETSWCGDREWPLNENLKTRYSL